MKTKSCEKRDQRFLYIEIGQRWAIDFHLKNKANQ